MDRYERRIEAMKDRIVQAQADHALARIEDAVRVEREACALIVQRIGGTLCFDAATAIRARGE